METSSARSQPASETCIRDPRRSGPHSRGGDGTLPYRRGHNRTWPEIPTVLCEPIRSKGNLASKKQRSGERRTSSRRVRLAIWPQAPRLYFRQCPLALQPVDQAHPDGCGIGNGKSSHVWAELGPGAEVADLHAIAALTGQGASAYAGITRPSLDLETVLPLPATLPADLLSRRPDVLAARARVDAAAKGRDAAHAEFYPDINLEAMSGLQALGMAALFTSNALTLGAGPAVHLPIFDAEKFAPIILAPRPAWTLPSRTIIALCSTRSSRQPTRWRKSEI